MFWITNNNLALARRARMKTMYFEPVPDRISPVPVHSIYSGKTMKTCAKN
jgi:hypothetical protein